MKKQSGFTLIELLLVLAIIGIISAIAVPALLNQRSNARDKSASSNCVNVLANFVTACEKAREDGLAVESEADFQANVIGTSASDSAMPILWTTTNPWPMEGKLEGYNTTLVTETMNDGDKTKGAANSPDLKGQVQIGYMPYSGTTPATVFTAVYLNKVIIKGEDNHVLVRSVGVD